MVYTSEQLKCIESGSKEGVTIIEGPPGTGKTDIVVEIIRKIYRENPKEKILVITQNNSALNDIFMKIEKI